MRCRGCDYPLWDLRARRCPECGRPFAPSEYEFAPNAVQWCCPHCEQEYYGDGPRGELVPGEFSCVRCAAPLRMDDMVVRLAPGTDEAEALPVLPWLRRAVHGRVRAWLETVGSALVRPGAMMRLVPLESGLRPAFLFAVVTQALAGLLSMLPVLAMMGFAASAAARAAGGPGLAAPLMGTSVVLALMFIAAAIVGPFIWGLLAHGTLLVTGGAEHGARRTLQALLYASGSSVVNAVPCVGGYIGWIWWLVSATLAVRSAQRVHGGRAALAVLWPPLVLLVVAVGGWAFLLIGAVAVATKGPPPAIGKAGELTVDAVGAALGRWRAAGPTRPLRHPLELVVLWDLPAQQLVVPDGTVDLAEFTVDGVPLDRIGALAEHERRALLEDAIAALPADWSAVRVGDMVLFRRPDFPGPLEDRASAWLAAIAPERDAAPEFLAVLTVGGERLDLPPGVISALLDLENRFRAEEGLLPIPAPFETLGEGAP